MLGVFLLPRARLHLVEARAHDHLHVFPAQAARGAAAVHRGIAAPEHDDPAADLRGVAERHRGQPVDAQVDVGCRFPAARQVEVAPARCAGADEHRVEVLREQVAHRADLGAATEVDAQVDHVADLFVDHRLGQAEARDLRADEATGLRVAVEHRDRVPQRRQVACDGERGRTGTDAGDAAAVAVRGRRRQQRTDRRGVLVVGGDALEPADRDRLGLVLVGLLDPSTPAGRLARSIAGAPQDAREHVGIPVDLVGLGVAPGRDQPDVFGHGRVRGARVLAIDDLVEILRITDIRRLQAALLQRFGPTHLPAAGARRKVPGRRRPAAIARDPSNGAVDTPRGPADRSVLVISKSYSHSASKASAAPGLVTRMTGRRRTGGRCGQESPPVASCNCHQTALPFRPPFNRRSP